MNYSNIARYFKGWLDNTCSKWEQNHTALRIYTDDDNVKVVAHGLGKYNRFATLSQGDLVPVKNITKAEDYIILIIEELNKQGIEPDEVVLYNECKWLTAIEIDEKMYKVKYPL